MIPPTAETHHSLVDSQRKITRNDDNCNKSGEPCPTAVLAELLALTDSVKRLLHSDTGHWAFARPSGRNGS